MKLFISCTKSGLPLFLKGNDWPETIFPFHEGDDDDDDDDGGIDVAPAAYTAKILGRDSAEDEEP